ncbi:right-handed parallel beta-helix repeat-containing protein [bacterium]|nr:right-handed parallel beta-helix repeat-containing protein [bacterium]
MRKTNVFLWIFCILMTQFCLVSLTFGDDWPTEYYVDCLTGSDYYFCQTNSPDHPFETIDRAISCIKGCNENIFPCSSYDYVINIMGRNKCVYDDLHEEGTGKHVVSVSGKGNSITLRAWDVNHKPTIRTSQSSGYNQFGIILHRPDVIVQNLILECTGLRPDCVPSFEENNCEFNDTGFMIIGDNTTGPPEQNDTIIESCEISGFDVGISAMCVADNGPLFRENEIYNCTSGIWIHHTTKTVELNDIHDNGVGVYISCGDMGSVIKENYIHNNKYNGIRLDQTYYSYCAVDRNASPMQWLNQIKTIIVDNVITNNGLNGPQYPAYEAYQAGSGISLYLIDFETPCNVFDDPPPPPGEVTPKIFNNVLANNLNGIILTCGANPLIENNLIVSDGLLCENMNNYGIIIDNDATLKRNPSLMKNPPCCAYYCNSDPLADGPCVENCQLSQNGKITCTWKNMSHFICHLEDIESIINMNTIDGFCDDGIFLTKDSTGRLNFSPSYQPAIHFSTITNNAGYGVNCMNFSSGSDLIDYFYLNNWNNSTPYNNCFCLPPLCQTDNPQYREGDYPVWSTSMSFVSDYYLDQSISPLLNKFLGNPWHQNLPMPILYTDPDLYTPDSSPWDIGFHYQDGNWYEIE